MSTESGERSGEVKYCSTDSPVVAVLFADSHLQDRAWVNRDIVGDSYRSFAQIITYAIQHEVEFVIGAGDLLDRQVNRSNPVVEMHRQLDRFAEALPGSEFLYVQGQHEKDNTPWLASHRATRHIHGQVVAVGPYNCYGLDFQPFGDLQKKLLEIPSCASLLVAHQAWSDFMGEHAASQGCLADIPTVNQVFTGDFHQYRDVTAVGKSGQVLRVISPGSTCLQSIDEPPDKYFVALRANGQFEKVPLVTRPVLVWPSPVVTEEDLDQVVAALPAAIEALSGRAARVPDATDHRPILVMRYAPSLEKAQRRISDAVADRAHLFLRQVVQKDAELAPDFTGCRAGEEITMAGMLDDFLVARGLSVVRDHAVRLLQATNIEDELLMLKNRVLTNR